MTVKITARWMNVSAVAGAYMDVYNIFIDQYLYVDRWRSSKLIV